MILKGNNRSRNAQVNQSTDSNQERSSSFLRTFQMKHQEKSLLTLNNPKYQQKTKDLSNLDSTFYKDFMVPQMLRTYSKPLLVPSHKQIKLKKEQVKQSQFIYKKSSQLYLKQKKQLLEKKNIHFQSNGNLVSKIDSQTSESHLQNFNLRQSSFSISSSFKDDSTPQKLKLPRKTFNLNGKRKSQDGSEHVATVEGVAKLPKQVELQSKLKKYNTKKISLNSRFINNELQSTSVSYEMQPFAYKTQLSDESQISIKQSGQKPVRHVMIDLYGHENQEKGHQRQLRNITERVQQLLKSQKEEIQDLKNELQESKEENLCLKKELERIKEVRNQ